MEQAIGGYEKQPQEAKYKGLIKKLNTSKHLARSGVSPEALIALKQGQVSGPEALEIYKNMNLALYGHEGGTKYMRLAAMPQLAEGGIVTKPTAAVIGEKGPEMVIPLHEQRRTNKDMVDELKKQNKLMTDMIKAQKETQAPEIRLDGRKISESVGENFYDTGLGI